jgi:hypothetical protein
MFLQVDGGPYEWLFTSCAPATSQSCTWTVPDRPGSARLGFTTLEWPYWGAVDYSPPFSIVSGPAEADLSVTSTVSPTLTRPGDVATFTVVVSNAGPSSVSVPVTGTLFGPLLNPTWQCAGPAPGVCTASGEGAIRDAAGVPSGASVTYTVKVDVSGAVQDPPATSISLRVSVGVPAPISDPNPKNNTAVARTQVKAVQVVSPDGGEIWTAGSRHRLEWRGTDTGAYDVSFTDGATTVPIARLFHGSPHASYDWVVPSAPSRGRIRVSLLDASGGSRMAVDESDEDFSIVDPAPAPKPLDLDGDGQADLLWRNRKSGRFEAWLMEGTTRKGVVAEAVTGAGAWQLRGCGDFDGDGRMELVWHSAPRGAVCVSPLRGMARQPCVPLSATEPDRQWQVVGVADLNGDGKPDVLWRHEGTGELRAWFVDGTTVTGTSAVASGQVAGPAWRVAAVIDLTRDGKADILWSNPGTGSLADWVLDGTSFVEAHALRPGRVSDPGWEIARVDDFDGDGQPDIVWRHAQTGALCVWFLDGRVASRSQYLDPAGQPDLDWEIEPSPASRRLRRP